MRLFYLATLLLFSILAKSQVIDSLNTAKKCLYMTEIEREMIYEINRVRHTPKSYIQYLQPMLNEATASLKKYGKGEKNYSVTFSSTTRDGKTVETTDTTWHYINQEKVKALTTLINDLKKLKLLSILQPDSGIYNAATKHARDQDEHDWKLMHTGSDGSDPWDRITLFSPAMSFGNENIAGNSMHIVTARDIVIQLLVDSGIPGYGHRYNLLDPAWTYCACKHDLFKGMHWWIQNFGVKKKKEI
jgi:uncharacterized protein YkwD